jgi:hypothetical protein
MFVVMHFYYSYERQFHLTDAMSDKLSSSLHHQLQNGALVGNYTDS